MLEKTRGIFLHAVKYSETSLIATIYTEVYGRQSFIINGVHSKNSPVKAAAFQPLYLLDLEIYYKAGKDIQRLKNARIINPYSTIPFDICKSTQVLFLSEILYKCLREEEPNSELFGFIFHSLTFLDLTDSGVGNFHLWFLFKLTQFLGIFPSQDNSRISNFFDLQSALFVSHEPLHNHFADKQLTVLFSRLFEVDFSSIEKLDYTHHERRLVLEKLLEFYQIHFDNLGEIRSLNVLKEVLK
ncbi:MAG: DNA repair protein RecO [Bacteroidota bacterium]|nr:DNA repair protein RecO [Odoribacter sp.]MDP3643799.1 DNA repair protein RecO [Bacteroidota bacterium]